MRISDWSSNVCSSDLLGFYNKRSETIWRFREALDPSQPGGSPIALPPDPMLVADLTAPTFTVPPRGIKVESKEDVCKRLGRSTDRGDAVVMAWRSEEHTSELQSLMRISYAVFCLKKKNSIITNCTQNHHKSQRHNQL